MKKIIKKELCQTLPITIIGIVILITFFGICNLLLPGVIALYIGGILSFLYLYYTEEFRLISIFKEKGMVFFTIIYVGLMAANYFCQFNVWDEYTYWSIASKHFYLTDTINFSKLNTMPVGVNIWYPTNPTVFQYFCMKLFGSYRQGYELFASQIMGFSLLLPLFKYVKSKTNKVFISMICLFLPAIFADSQFYHTIYVDCLLGLLTGFVLLEYLTEKNKKYQNLILILGVIITALTKASGFMFSLVILIFYFSKYFIEEIKYKKKCAQILKDIFTHKMFYILLITIVFVFGGWRLYCQKNIPITNYKGLSTATVVGFNDGGNIFKSTIGAITGLGYDEHSEVLRLFFKNLFDRTTYTHLPVDLNVTSWIVIIIFSFLTIFKISKSDEKKMVKSTAICLIISIIAYILLLELSYLVMFATREAIGNFSSERYIGSILLSAVIVLIGLGVYNSKDSKLINNVCLVTFCLVLLFTPLDKVAQGTILSGSRNYYNISYLKREKMLADIVVKNVKKDEKITTISQSPVSNSLLKIIYFATPFKIHYTNIINGDNYNELKYENILKNSDYIMTVEIDTFIIKKIKSLYNIDLEPYTLYKIKNDQMIKIKKAILKYENSNEIGYIKEEKV
ncbi:MAG: hypothetical protein RR697_03355 [Malacoplasma sp.]